MSGTDGGQHRGNEPRHGSCGGQRCGACSSWCGDGCVLHIRTSFTTRNTQTPTAFTFVVIMVVVGVMVMIVVVVMMMVVVVVNLPSNWNQIIKIVD